MCIDLSKRLYAVSNCARPCKEASKKAVKIGSSRSKPDTAHFHKNQLLWVVSKKSEHP